MEEEQFPPFGDGSDDDGEEMEPVAVGSKHDPTPCEAPCVTGRYRSVRVPELSFLVAAAADGSAVIDTRGLPGVGCRAVSAKVEIDEPEPESGDGARSQPAAARILLADGGVGAWRRAAAGSDGDGDASGGAEAEVLYDAEETVAWIEWAGGRWDRGLWFQEAPAAEDPSEDYPAPPAVAARIGTCGPPAPSSPSASGEGEDKCSTPQQQSVAEGLADECPPYEADLRARWSRVGYLAALAGAVTGLTTLWRFPYLCMKHGGGSFIVPYALALFLVALPLMVLELSVAQRFQRGSGAAWTRVHSAMAGVGHCTLAVAVLLLLYQVVVMGWAGIMFTASCNDPLPWERYGVRATLYDESDDVYNCTIPPVLQEVQVVDRTVTNADGTVTTQVGRVLVERSSDHLKTAEYLSRCRVCTDSASDYFYRTALSVMSARCDAVGTASEGSIAGRAYGAAVVAWLMVAAGSVFGIKSVSHVSVATVPVSLVLLLVLMFRAVSLSGSSAGTGAYLGDFDWAVLTTPQVWGDATGQAVLTTAIATGVMTAYGSGRPRGASVAREAVMLCGYNMGFSILAGLMVYGFVGHLVETERTSCEADLCAAIAANTSHPCRWSAAVNSGSSAPLGSQMCTQFGELLYVLPGCADECRGSLASVANHGAATVFTVLPRAIRDVPSANLFTALLFILVWLVAWDSCIALVQSVTTTVVDDILAPDAYGFSARSVPVVEEAAEREAAEGADAEKATDADAPPASDPPMATASAPPIPPDQPEGMALHFGRSWQLRAAVVLGLAGLGLIWAFLYTADIGLYWVDVMDHYVNGYVVICIAIAQTFGTVWGLAIRSDTAKVGASSARLVAMTWFWASACFVCVAMSASVDQGSCGETQWRLEGQNSSGARASTWCPSLSFSDCQRQPECTDLRGGCTARILTLNSEDQELQGTREYSMGVPPWEQDAVVWGSGQFRQESIGGRAVYTAPTSLFAVCGPPFAAAVRSVPGLTGMSYADTVALQGCIEASVTVCSTAGPLTVAACVLLGILLLGWGAAFTATAKLMTPAEFVSTVLLSGAWEQAAFIARASGHDLNGGDLGAWAATILAILWSVSVKYVSSIALAFVVASRFREDTNRAYGGYPGWMQCIMFVITTALVLALIVLGVLGFLDPHWGEADEFTDDAGLREGAADRRKRCVAEDVAAEELPQVFDEEVCGVFSPLPVVPVAELLPRSDVLILPPRCSDDADGYAEPGPPFDTGDGALASFRRQYGWARVHECSDDACLMDFRCGAGPGWVSNQYLDAAPKFVACTPPPEGELVVSQGRVLSRYVFYGDSRESSDDTSDSDGDSGSGSHSSKDGSRDSSAEPPQRKPRRPPALVATDPSGGSWMRQRLARRSELFHLLPTSPPDGWASALPHGAAASGDAAAGWQPWAMQGGIVETDSGTGATVLWVRTTASTAKRKKRGIDGAAALPLTPAHVDPVPGGEPADEEGVVDGGDGPRLVRGLRVDDPLVADPMRCN
eukprot:TRINITY_DN35755_c0_g1_i1.p1 TRINITY_DN35755_c0_g1~~TRINITY_DN35755_c0_g1_i1.p1  ORF type:complete len:1515 (+),score=448.51 TRINITY_DN35755_c0_g1_i1:47-4546(+)